ncbi:hypothetical protein [Bacillus piscicola]|uniref:hypothetical protein n=1 Tax=Bacillus piscicola TaxID=1632684 RepID=UPI001F0902E3|nr:hypothetical protein [Bacillus piscicola]
MDKKMVYALYCAFYSLFSLVLGWLFHSNPHTREVEWLYSIQTTIASMLFIISITMAVFTIILIMMTTNKKRGKHKRLPFFKQGAFVFKQGEVNTNKQGKN